MSRALATAAPFDHRPHWRGHSHDGDNAMAVEEREGLDRQLQASLARDEDHPLVFASLLGSNGRANRSPGCIADAAVDCLGPLCRVPREIRGEEAALRGARLGDNEIPLFEEVSEPLSLDVVSNGASSQRGQQTYGPEPVLSDLGHWRGLRERPRRHLHSRASS